MLWADGCHPLLLRAGRSLDDARLVGPAVEYWRDLSARCDTKLMPGHPDALVVAGHLAAAYLAAGYAGEAVHWYQRVLAERGRELAPGHPAIIAARVNLAKALIMAGRTRRRGNGPAARRQRVRAVPRAQGTRTPSARRDDLAAAYQAAGDVAAAARLLSRNLTDRERLQGPRDAETMATRDRLAAAFLAEGKIKDAISHYKRALSDREKVLGRDHPDTIATTANLAAAYQAAGGCRPRCSSPSSAARIPSGFSAPIMRTRSRAWLTWLTFTTPRAGSATRWPCSATPSCAANGCCPRAIH